MSSSTQYRRSTNESLVSGSESLRPIAHRPVITVGVGERGRSIIGGIASNKQTADELLTDQSGAEAWQQAIGNVLNHPPSPAVLRGSDVVYVLLVGDGDDIEAWTGWHEYRAMMIQQSPLKALVLCLDRIPRKSTTNSDGSVVQSCLANTYHGGILSEQQVTELAVLMLRAGLAHSLFDTAFRQREVSQATIGAALAWLPEIEVSVALSAFLVEELSRLIVEVCRVATPKPLRLFQPTALLGLELRLKPILARHKGTALRTFPGRFRRIACSSFAVAREVLPSAFHDAVNAWLSEQTKMMCDFLEERLAHASDLPRILTSLEDAIAKIRPVEHDLANQRRDVAEKRNDLSELGISQDDCRMHGKKWFVPVGMILTWWRTLRVRLTLRKFLDVRNQELLIEFKADALRRFREELETIHSRLRRLVDDAGNCPAILDQHLRPPHPMLISIQDRASLRILVTELAGWFLQVMGIPASQQVWAKVIPHLIHDRSADPWLVLITACSSVSASHSQANCPLAEKCLIMFPHYRQTTLANLVINMARSAQSKSSQPSWLEQTTLVDVPNDTGISSAIANYRPAAICFRWISEESVGITE